MAYSTLNNMFCSMFEQLLQHLGFVVLPELELERGLIIQTSAAAAQSYN
jgi:hypothetical protein